MEDTQQQLRNHFKLSELGGGQRWAAPFSPQQLHNTGKHCGLR